MNTAVILIPIAIDKLAASTLTSSDTIGMIISLALLGLALLLAAFSRSS